MQNVTRKVTFKENKKNRTKCWKRKYVKLLHAQRMVIKTYKITLKFKNSTVTLHIYFPK